MNCHVLSRLVVVGINGFHVCVRLGPSISVRVVTALVLLIFVLGLPSVELLSPTLHLNLIFVILIGVVVHYSFVLAIVGLLILRLLLFAVLNGCFLLLLQLFVDSLDSSNTQLRGFCSQWFELIGVSKFPGRVLPLVFRMNLNHLVKYLIDLVFDYRVAGEIFPEFDTATLFPFIVRSIESDKVDLSRSIDNFLSWIGISKVFQPLNTIVLHSHIE